MPSVRMLAHKPNGDCLYLTGVGCAIHESKPQQCREMDCRNIAERISVNTARKMRLLPVWRRGKELLNAASRESRRESE